MTEKSYGLIENDKRFPLSEPKISAWMNPKVGQICPHHIFLDGFVDDKKKYRKLVGCGKEICPVCGVPGSLHHRQTIAKWTQKILGAEVLGYFDITFPLEVRAYFGKKMLNSFTDYINDLLETYEWRIGSVSRWHWGGDEHRGIYHPHLNILINLRAGKGFIPPKDIYEIGIKMYNS